MHGGVELALRNDAPPVPLGETRGLCAYLRMRISQTQSHRERVSSVSAQLLKIEEKKTKKQFRFNLAHHKTISEGVHTVTFMRAAIHRTAVAIS